MREIKFRALKDNMSNCNFVYGCLVYDAVGTTRIAVKDSSGDGLLFYSCINGTEGQFTGLHDKNGKEIYEDDILKIDGTKMYQNCKPKPKKGEYLGFFKVEINVGDYGISVDFEHINGYECVTHIMGDTANVNSTNIEIIGNIHENPELLKQEKV